MNDTGNIWRLRIHQSGVNLNYEEVGHIIAGKRNRGFDKAMLRQRLAHVQRRPEMTL